MVKVGEAVASYLDDCRSRKLAPTTLTRYEHVLNALHEFCIEQGIAHLYEVNLDTLTRYRTARNLSSSTQRVEIETLRAWGSFCVDRNWMQQNWAKKVKPPKNDAPATLPFTPDEVQGLLDACDRIDNPNPREIARARLRARAALLAMLYGGLRISDVVALRRSHLDRKTGRLFLRQMEKTNQPLYVRLHPDAIAALDALPVEHSDYCFWNGEAKASTIAGSIRRTFECLSRMTGIRAHPHRCRDTFACEMLLKGVDLRTVSQLLGHVSIRTTERHYAPFVAAFQVRLDDAVGKLDFGSSAPLIQNSFENALGDTKANVIAFPATA
jgi:site-specific recombinase XerD